MPPTKLICNGVDLSTYGMWIETPRGWADAPARRDRTIDVQGAGEMVVPRAATMRGRSWSIEGSLIAPTQQDALDLWDLAKLHLHNAWLDIMILPWTDRIAICRYEGMQWSEGRLEDDALRFTLNFYSPSAYLVSPIVDSYGLSTTEAVALLLGTAPSPFIVEFIGPATRPTLSYYDASGQLRGTVALAGDLATGEWLHYNSQTFLMLRHTATGTVVNGAPLFDNTSRDFALEPLDGVPGRGPTLALDSGTALVYTRRCYL